jgi:predicted ATP-dependent endonuclease of OLD family
MISDCLTPAELAALALSYRAAKDSFVSDPRIVAVNDKLAATANKASKKLLSVALDTSSKSSWGSGVVAHLDEIPLSLAGRGEHSCVKTRLAIAKSSAAHVLLVEEPENHLSHANLNGLLGEIEKLGAGRQLIVTTHSSFVMNKLHLRGVILFRGDKHTSLAELSEETSNYFARLPGYNTLRLVLASHVILVEGPSDELIVHLGFRRSFACAPLEKGCDVISVGSLAFRRFLEVAQLLSLHAIVITDNDGKPDVVKKRYASFAFTPGIEIHVDDNPDLSTLEPQILNANNLESVNRALETSFGTNTDLLDYMKNNKADCALKIFGSDVALNIPKYINDVVKQFGP